MQPNPDNYDLIACQAGAAINLGYIDEVFTKCDQLIRLNGEKAQVKFWCIFESLFNYLIVIFLLKGLLFKGPS